MALAGASGGPFAVGLTAAGGGVHPAFGNRLAVTGTAGMTVNVDTGLVYMSGSTAWQGMYAGINTASYSVNVPAANASQWRSDYIAAVQTDTAYAVGADTWDIVDVPGAFSGSSPGSLPSLPNSAVILAIIRVVPNMTATNGGGTVVDSRQYVSLPGPLWTVSASKPSLTCPEGTMWWETDTHQLGIIVSGAYKYLYSAPDPWHTMTLMNSWTNTGAPYVLAQYRKVSGNPDLVEVVGSLQHASISGASQFWTPPTGYIPVSNQPLILNDINSTTVYGANPPRVLIVPATPSIEFRNLPAGTTVADFSGFYSLTA